jgi:hypothetical protein
MLSNHKDYVNSPDTRRSHGGLLYKRTGGGKATLRPKIFSRNNYMGVIGSVWATNLAQSFPLKSLPGS